MKFSEITGAAATLLGWEEPYGNNRDASLLDRCANLALKELAVEYAPPIALEEATSDNGIIGLAALQKDAVEVLAVYGAGGAEIPFTAYSDHIKTAPGDVTLRYSYLPETVSGNQEAAVGDRRLTALTIAYGVASEYCLVAGRFDEAVIFNNKFVSSVHGALFRAGGRVAERSFL